MKREEGKNCAKEHSKQTVDIKHMVLRAMTKFLKRGLSQTKLISFL